MNMKWIGTSPLLKVAVVAAIAAFGVGTPGRSQAQEALSSKLPRTPVLSATEALAVTAANVYLTGIEKVGTSKKAYFKIVLESKMTDQDRSRNSLIAEGEEDRGVRVVHVDLKAGTAMVRFNEADPIELRVGTDGLLPQASGLPGSATYLTGLSDISGRKVAYFRVVLGPQPKRCLYLMLAEGQKESGVEVLQINAEAGTVRVRIDGRAPVQLTFRPANQSGAVKAKTNK